MACVHVCILYNILSFGCCLCVHHVHVRVNSIELIFLEFIQIDTHIHVQFLYKLLSKLIHICHYRNSRWKGTDSHVHANCSNVHAITVRVTIRWSDIFIFKLLFVQIIIVALIIGNIFSKVATMDSHCIPLYCIQWAVSPISQRFQHISWLIISRGFDTLLFTVNIYMYQRVIL